MKATTFVRFHGDLIIKNVNNIRMIRYKSLERWLVITAHSFFSPISVDMGKGNMFSSLHISRSHQI